MPSQKRVKDLLDYKDGRFYWKTRKGNAFPPGKEAGGIFKLKKRWKIGFDGKSYYRSRLVWIYHHGNTDFTNLVIDHVNRDTLDDRIENLRLIRQRQNMANTKNQSPYGVGVYKARKDTHSKPYHVRLHIGCYSTPEEAQKVYRQAIFRLGDLLTAM